MDLEFENIVLIVTFLILISLVYMTGFIVWVCCRQTESAISVTSMESNSDYKRPLFPVATPSPIHPRMISQNFPLHALLLLFFALAEKRYAVNNQEKPVEDETKDSTVLKTVTSEPKIATVHVEVSEEMLSKSEVKAKTIPMRDKSTMTTFLYEVSLV